MVFLSYASQDSEAAQRICDALRAAGVEVFLDQSELRGGDAWDQKIRHEIHDCALFIPIVSHHTQKRLEGYFRREWKLAIDRTHDMAEQKPFLVPVVIDGTRDQEAFVPDAFRAVQWTRLPGGETPPAFVERIKRLMSPELSPMSAVSGPAREIREAVRPAQRSKSVLLDDRCRRRFRGSRLLCRWQVLDPEVPYGRPSHVRPAAALDSGAALCKYEWR